LAILRNSQRDGFQRKKMIEEKLIFKLIFPIIESIFYSLIYFLIKDIDGGVLKC